MLDDPSVSLIHEPALEYPASPFHPGEDYPEYVFGGLGYIDRGNGVYGAVRNALKLLGLDAANDGTLEWNPFGSFVKPGATVLIKPNAVCDINYKPNESVFASITHASVLRPVVDYAYKALQGQGRIIVADSPLMHSDFENWRRVTGIDSVVELYRQHFGFEIPVVDLRLLYVPWDRKHGFARCQGRAVAVRDPSGYVDVDLGNASCFADFTEQDVRRLYGSDYDRGTTVANHGNGHHIYKVARTVLNADVLISVPKFKVHSKVGVTLNLKGMVGTQGDKNFIPHHRIGDPSRGGDEYPDLGWSQNALNRFRMWTLTHLLARKTRTSDLTFQALDCIRSWCQHLIDVRGFRKHGHQYRGNILGGTWHGNDTAWRMSLDLTRIVLYCDRDGTLHDSPQRQLFSVVDGVMGGEDEGPLAPTGRQCGVILAGFNPLAVDAVAARLMGFDPARIRLLSSGFLQDWLKRWPGSFQDVRVLADQSRYSTSPVNHDDSFLNFVPPKGWIGHIEMRPAAEALSAGFSSHDRSFRSDLSRCRHTLTCTANPHAIPERARADHLVRHVPPPSLRDC